MRTPSIAVTGSFAGRCQASSPTQGSACRVVLRRGRAPALTPALRTGEPPKRRLQAAVISSARKRRDRWRLCRAKRALDREGRAAGSHRGGRERPPYNSPQLGAGERNGGRKGKVSGFTCRLPCIVGRAISPAGEPGGQPEALRDDAKHRPLRRGPACRVVLRRGRAPALTPALRAGEPSKRRLRAAVISSARKRCDRGKLCRTKRALDREGRGNRKSPRPKTAPQFLFFTRSPGTPSGWPE